MKKSFPTVADLSTKQLGLLGLLNINTSKLDARIEREMNPPKKADIKERLEKSVKRVKVKKCDDLFNAVSEDRYLKVTNIRFSNSQ